MRRRENAKAASAEESGKGGDDIDLLVKLSHALQQGRWASGAKPILEANPQLMDDATISKLEGLVKACQKSGDERRAKLFSIVSLVLKESSKVGIDDFFSRFGSDTEFTAERMKKHKELVNLNSNKEMWGVLGAFALTMVLLLLIGLGVWQLLKMYHPSNANFTIEKN